MMPVSKKLKVRLLDGRKVAAKVSVVPHLNDLTDAIAELAADLAALAEHCAEFGGMLDAKDVEGLIDAYGMGFTCRKGLGGVLVYTAGPQSQCVSVWIEPETT